MLVQTVWLTAKTCGYLILVKFFAFIFNTQHILNVIASVLDRIEIFNLYMILISIKEILYEQYKQWLIRDLFTIFLILCVGKRWCTKKKEDIKWIEIKLAKNYINHTNAVGQNVAQSFTMYY